MPYLVNIISQPYSTMLVHDATRDSKSTTVTTVWAHLMDYITLPWPKLSTCTFCYYYTLTFTN